MGIPVTVVKTIPFPAFEKYEQRRRTLRYDINALADFEQLTGMGFGQLMQTRAVFATVRALLYAGLKHEDRSLTVEDVGQLMFAFLNDDDVEEPNSNDMLMTMALEAAVKQGALGRQARRQAEEKNAQRLAEVDQSEPK